MGLSCTLSYLLWKSSVNGKPCSGSLVKIETLSDPVNSKFIGYDATQTYTISSLLTNRLTPYQLTKENFSGLDVCKSHLVSTHCMDCLEKKNYHSEYEDIFVSGLADSVTPCIETNSLLCSNRRCF